MARQYFIPEFGMVNDSADKEYFIPEFGMINENSGGGGPEPGPNSQDKLMRHGVYFEDGVKQPFWWAR